MYIRGLQAVDVLIIFVKQGLESSLSSLKVQSESGKGRLQKAVSIVADIHFVRTVPRGRVQIGQGCISVRGRLVELTADNCTLLLRNVHQVLTMCALTPLVCDKHHMHHPERNPTSLDKLGKHKTYRY